MASILVIGLVSFFGSVTNVAVHGRSPTALFNIKFVPQKSFQDSLNQNLKSAKSSPVKIQNVQIPPSSFTNTSATKATPIATDPGMYIFEGHNRVKRQAARRGRRGRGGGRGRGRGGGRRKPPTTKAPGQAQEIEPVEIEGATTAAPPAQGGRGGPPPYHTTPGPWYNPPPPPTPPPPMFYSSWNPFYDNFLDLDPFWFDAFTPIGAIGAVNPHSGWAQHNNYFSQQQQTVHYPQYDAHPTNPQPHQQHHQPVHDLYPPQHQQSRQHQQQQYHHQPQQHVAAQPAYNTAPTPYYLDMTTGVPKTTPAGEIEIEGPPAKPKSKKTKKKVKKFKGRKKKAKGRKKKVKGRKKKAKGRKKTQGRRKGKGKWKGRKKAGKRGKGRKGKGKGKKVPPH